MTVNENMNKTGGVDIALVILHYKTLKETLDCVTSIKKNLDSQNYSIVIVDNASPNGTGDELLARFSSDERCTVIKSNENLGFARGNNLGIDYARNTLKAQFVACFNNDTILACKNFWSVIKQEYDKSHAAIIGPKIWCVKDKKYSLPWVLKTVDAYEKQLKNQEARLKGNFLKDPNRYANEGKSRLKVFLKSVTPLRAVVLNSRVKIKRFVTHLKSRRIYRDRVLQGACLIFSPAFFEKYPGFCDKTFLYFEEHLLATMCIIADLHTVYLPSIKIIHLGASSTSEEISDLDCNDEKAKFTLRHDTDSLKILIDYLKENGLDGGGQNSIRRRKLKEDVIATFDGTGKYTQELDYIKRHPFLNVFNYDWADVAKKREVKVYHNEHCHLHYVDHNGKALYFPKKWSKEAIAKNWRDIAFVEQNEHPPHLYRDEEIERYKNGIVIELGAAEGSFSLEMADSAKELWIFECDKNWRAPLKATFAKYKNVHIVPKLVGDKNGGRYCTVDKALGKRAKDVTLIKMDIEGFECEALKGAKRVISEAEHLAILCCAYHKEGDEGRIRGLLGSDFEVTARDGYMLFIYDKKLAAPYFRHGVLKCIKKE